MTTKSYFSRILTGLVLALSASMAQADIIELEITASWSASDFDVSSTLFGDDDKVFGVAPSEGSTSFTLLVDTSSMVSYSTGEFGVTHDWFGYSNVTLAGTHSFGSASWETSDILTGLVGPNESAAALWTDTDISIAAPSLISFRMIGDWPGGNADLFVGPRIVNPNNSTWWISTQFLMHEYYGGEVIRRVSNALTTSVAAPDLSGIYGGVEFPAGAVSFADHMFGYDPMYGGGPAPDETQQDARQILGVPEQGEMSLGRGGRVRLQFLDNSLTGSDDPQPDLYVFEVGGPETTYVDISRDGRRWISVGTATGFAYGIDIDQHGFGSADRFSFVRLTDDGDSSGDHHFTAGADLVAVGARSSGPPVTKQPPINYYIQAHVGGRSELMIQRNLLQWHHLKGPAPGLERAFWNFGSDSNSPTIIDSNQGPNIPWVPSGWPMNIGNGTHPESYSSVFNALTPVFPTDGRCWKLTKLWGKGTTSIVQQPNKSNDYTMVIRFDDLLLGKANRGRRSSGAQYGLHGSGFYSIKLTPTYTNC